MPGASPKVSSSNPATACACADVDGARTMPLGLPVVPEVYTIARGAWLGGSDRGPCSANQSS
jgi:hypothetical protein